MSADDHSSRPHLVLVVRNAPDVVRPREIALRDRAVLYCIEGGRMQGAASARRRSRAML